MTLAHKQILLIIGGGIAAYKALELIRRLREQGAVVRCVLTAAGAKFVTPLSIAALCEQPVFQDLFDLKDETEMGHIQLSRQADMLVVCPATADLLAKMAGGHANDLASTVLLATDKPVLVVPAMNVRMWRHAATQRNIAQLAQDGVLVLPPVDGAMACGEFGPGRLPEVPEIVAAIVANLTPGLRPLAGHRALVTAGPTREPIDPVRYLSNHSSGKQGFAIASALAAAGAEVLLIAGPVALPTPPGVQRVDVDTAVQMQAAVVDALPATIAVCVAAVADWRVDGHGQKLKKRGSPPPTLQLLENPDILAQLSAPGPNRPKLVVGFAAETETVVDHAVAKRTKKGCDWIVANDVADGMGVMGGDCNRVHLITADGVQDWPVMSKTEVATRLTQAIAEQLVGPAAQ